MFSNRDNITTHRVFWNSAEGFGLPYICWEGLCDHGSGDAWCPVRSSTKRIIPSPAQCLHILPDVRQERKSHLYYLSLKPFYVNTNLWGFSQSFHIYIQHLTGMRLPCTRKDKCTLFCSKPYQELLTTSEGHLKDSPVCAFEASEQHTWISLYFSRHIRYWYAISVMNVPY